MLMSDSRSATLMQVETTTSSCRTALTAPRQRIFQRQFNLLLDRTGPKHDPMTSSNRSAYSLRHTAICMRIILSHGQVNVFNLAKNAGTSVNQIERFYARHLPLSREVAKNLQSFGEGWDPYWLCARAQTVTI